MVMSLTERLKLTRQMAAAVGNKSTTSLSWFMEAYGLEVEEELSTMVAGSTEQKEAWMRQIREVQKWRQVRGPAGAVMCETRDLRIKWPRWHTLIFSNDTKIDMRFLCPKDVKKMLVQRARSVYWKKWAAKHQYEELKEGAWLEPGLALLRKNVSENWTEKSIAMWPGRSFWKELGRKKKAIRYWVVGYQSVSSLPDGGRHRKAQAPPLSGMARSEARYSKSFQEMGANGENVKERMEMAKRYSCTPSRWKPLE